MIRIMIMLSILAIAGWSGFWMFSREARLSWVESILSPPANTGWSVSYDTIKARGYPFRVDIDISDLAIRNDERGLAWHFPTLRLLMLSYRTDHVIIAFPKTQEMTLAGSHFRLDSSGMKASLTTNSSGKLLKAIIIEAERAMLTGDSGTVRTIENVLFASRHEPSAPGQYRVSLTSSHDDALPDAAILARRDSLLARLLMGMTLDGQITVSEPIGPASCNGSGLTLQGVALQDLTISEQDMAISLDSDMRFSATGTPVGWVDLRVNSVQRVLDLLETLGIQLGLASSLADKLIETPGESLPDGDIGFRVDFVDGFVSIFGFRVFDARPVQPLC